MKTIIGLAGVKTSGKSTVANMINEFVIAKESALADKLKNTCAEVFGLERKQFDSQDLKEKLFSEPFYLDMEQIISILMSFDLETDEKMLAKFKQTIGMKLESPRKIAQIVGTEVLRMAGDEDIHCKHVNLKDNGVTVISDLRFPNEFNFFNKGEFKFIPLYIHRDKAESLVTENSHSSETSVFKFSDKCIKIDNNGSFRETELQVKKALDENL